MHNNMGRNHKRKIGIMGGTFNPIHMGHLIIAEMAFEQFDLDKVIFMPAGKPPHKIGEVIEEDIKRVAMVELAIQDNPHFELSLYEINRRGLSYTASTLSYLTKEYKDTEFYFIVGGDSITSIEQWKEPEMVMQLCQLVACNRDEVDDDKLCDQILYLNEKYQAKVHKLDVPKLNISSTMIRDRLKSKMSIKYLVPEDVNAYIYKHDLYQ